MQLTTEESRALIAAGREHDEAMTQGWAVAGLYRFDSLDEQVERFLQDHSRYAGRPMHIVAVAESDRPIEESAVCFATTGNGPHGAPDAIGIAWLRNNLRALLDGYAAALVRIEALEKFCGIAGIMVDDLAAERDAANAEVKKLRYALSRAPLRTFDQIGADHLADEVCVLIDRKIIDSRSPAADALLDYRDPPRSPRSDRIVVIEKSAAGLQAEVLRLTETARTAAENWMAACQQRDESRAESDRLRVECDDSADRDAELYRLRFAIRAMHAEVDQTNPNCPVGVALTKAGL